MDDNNCTFLGQHISAADTGNQTRLRNVIRSKNKALVKKLLESGVEAKGYRMNISYDRPLHLAVISRSFETVKLLLDAGADINENNWNDETALTLAARIENTSIVDLLLSGDVKNYSNIHNNFSHLHIACMRNKVDLVKKLLLLNQGTDVNLTVKENSDAKQMTALHLAHYYQNEEIMDSILAKHKYEFRNPVSAEGISHFHIACIRDNVTIVEHFLKSGIDVNLKIVSPAWRGWSLMHFAIYYECPNVMKLLMTSKICFASSNFFAILKFSFRMGQQTIYDMCPDRRATFGKIDDQCQHLTELHHACIQNDVAKIKELLSSEKISVPSDFNVPIWTGCTAVHLAARSKSADVFQFLLDHGANLTLQDNGNKTALHIAFEKRQFGIVDSIVKSWDKDSRNLTDNTGLSVFHILCSTDESEKVIENLISNGTNINAAVGNESALWAGFRPIHFATIFLKPSNVSILLQHGADILVKNGLDGYTALHLAMKRNFLDRAKLLVENGADFLIMNRNGETPLECAVSQLGFDYWDEGDAESLFPLDRMTFEYLKPSHFHLACALGFVNVVKHFLQNGVCADLKAKFMNSVNDARQTPLHSIFIEYPNEISQKQITHLLLENGSDVDARDFLLETPLHCVSSSSGDLEAMRILISYGADVNAQDLYGQTPLHKVTKSYLVKENSKKKMVLLLENGANINIMSERGRTCLSMLSNNQLVGVDDVRKDCCIILLQHVSKLKAIGLHVSDVNQKACEKLMKKCNGSFDETVFVNKCNKELELMVNFDINSFTKLHDILFMSSDEMVFHCKNVVLQTLVNSDEFFEKFRIYGFLIRLQLKRGRIRGLISTESEESLVQLSGKPLPSLCSEIIFQHLTNRDLKNIILSTKGFNTVSDKKL
ncbi:hypothetical protein QAD02_017724 [Eretmocerus hayati]|uniref:Uncharacterized protein n=1 Tax=Eretmocerus hayati TaxID=131215 RepID=A0ACC2PEQ7_9HYME|nr:hypothetical protein QAD02_017724 [Eretmocerus hayati]